MIVRDEKEAPNKEEDIAGFEKVLEEELDLLSDLRNGGIKHDTNVPIYQRARNYDLAGLALSGGGIRSATFNLGVIQALSKDGLLSKFDYLSTVSGGGFIGGWLSALLNRKAGKEIPKKTEEDNQKAVEHLEFIGGWLSALRNRKVEPKEIKVVNQEAVEDFQSCLKTHPDSACACDDNKDDKNVGFAPVEHLAVRYLRCYSNYLSPRLGLSGDMLAVVTIFLRNFTLIQLTLISLVASVLIFAHLLGTGSKELFALQAPWLHSGLLNIGQSFGLGSVSWLVPFSALLSNRWPFVVGALLLFFAFWSAGSLLSERALHDEKFHQETDKHAKNKRIKLRVYLSVIFPTLMAAWWFSAAAVIHPLEMQSAEIHPQEMHLNIGSIPNEALLNSVLLSQEVQIAEIRPHKSMLNKAWPWVLCGIIGYGFAWLFGYCGLSFKRKSNKNRMQNSADEKARIPEPKPALEPEVEEKYAGFKVFLSAVFSGALFGLLLFAAACKIKEVSSAGLIDPWYAVAFAPPLFILGLSFVVTVHVGMAQRSFNEGEREWLARLGGFTLFAAVVWMLPFALILYATPLIHWLAGGGIAALAAWAGGSGTGAWLAHGSSTGTSQDGSWWKEVVSRIAPWIFVIGLAIIVAHLTHIAMLESLTADGYVQPPGMDFSIAAASVLQQLNELPLAGTFYAFLLILALFVLIAWRLDINLFSLHALYCNRLARTYLGASRRAEERKPNPFSGFDFKDDMKFSQLAKQRPIPIINTAINMTGGDDLAWQTRRAASFAFTPMWSGYETRNSQGEKIGTYRPTDQYAKDRNLGTLMAVSGAAASPNMGYHTSAAAAALMTAFNLRLGRWCGNPERKTWDQISPWFAVKPIFAELAGSANAHADWINLTDGGHFDNLGVYELIRRRCRLIVVADAGCDPKHFFEDLANTVRKCWVDLGVNIRFDELEQVHLKKECRYSETHGAVGRIQYYDDGPDGVIIYLKNSMTGDEWPDIRQYADSHEGFPHETTADQFFDENQFEAYRHLGYKIAAKMAESLKEIRSDINDLTIEEIAYFLIPRESEKKPVQRD